MTKIVSQMTKMLSKSIKHSVVLVGGVVTTHAITLLGEEVKQSEFNYTS